MHFQDTKRVLVADDDPEVHRLLTAVLRPEGLNVDTAADGSEALTLLGERAYSVLVLDLFMPVADGFSVLQSLRATPPARMPVVLVLTGAYDRVIEQLDADVIHGVVRKPFDPSDLGALIRACAEMRVRSSLETMALTAIAAGTPLMALLVK